MLIRPHRLIPRLAGAFRGGIGQGLGGAGRIDNDLNAEPLGQRA
jgi:hypothetical protein